MKAVPVAAAETRSSDGHQLRWLMMLTMTCLGVLVLLMTLACSSLKPSVTSDDVITVHDCMVTSPPGGVRGIVMIMSVCLSARMHNPKTTWPNFTQILCTLPVAVARASSPPPVALRYVMFFRICE